MTKFEVHFKIKDGTCCTFVEVRDDQDINKAVLSACLKATSQMNNSLVHHEDISLPSMVISPDGKVYKVREFEIKLEEDVNSFAYVRREIKAHSRGLTSKEIEEMIGELKFAMNNHKKVYHLGWGYYAAKSNLINRDFYLGGIKVNHNNTEYVVIKS